MDNRAGKTAVLSTPCGPAPQATCDIPPALTALLTDLFALYVKTKNFHWHRSGPHFRESHLLLEGRAIQVHAITDPIAGQERSAGRERAQGRNRRFDRSYAHGVKVA